MTDRHTSLRTWSDELAARRPTPGGGAAAAAAAALGCGAAAMAARYTTGRKWADRAEAARQLAAQLDAWRQQALSLSEEDQERYRALQASWRNQELSDAQRHAIETAALDVMIRLCRLCAEASSALRAFRPQCNPLIISDVDVGLALLSGAAQGAAATARCGNPAADTLAELDALMACCERAGSS